MKIILTRYSTALQNRTRNADGKETRIRHEIDFVATQGSKKYYVQSALSLNSEEKEAQEKSSLRNVDDSFKKIVVVKDVMKVRRDEYGIVTIGLFDFLLSENSLEL